MVDIQIVCDVNDQIVKWFEEGKDLPGYKLYNGQRFLSKVILDKDFVGTKYFAGNASGSSVALANKFEEVWPDIHRKLLGPYGWTFMQILLINKREREQNEIDTSIQL